MFINSWPSRAALIIALQHAACRGIKDSPLVTEGQARSTLTRRTRLGQERSQIHLVQFNVLLKFVMFTERDTSSFKASFLRDTRSFLELISH